MKKAIALLFVLSFQLAAAKPISIQPPAEPQKSYCPNSNGKCCLENKGPNGSSTCTCFWPPNIETGRPYTEGCIFKGSCKDLEENPKEGCYLECTKHCDFPRLCDPFYTVTCPAQNCKPGNTNCTNSGLDHCTTSFMTCMQEVLSLPNNEKPEASQKCMDSFLKCSAENPMPATKPSDAVKTEAN